MNSSVKATILFVAFSLFALCSAVFPSKSFTEPEGLTCDICKTAFDTIQRLIRANASEDDIIKIATDICIQYKIPDYRNYTGVCQGIVPIFGPEIIYILSQKFIDPQIICEDLKACPKSFPKPKFPQGTFLLENQPPYFKGVTSLEKKKERANNPLKFFHISDIHFDPRYKPNTIIDCGLPICCRDGFPTDPSNSSGPFGQYQCDLPIISLNATLQSMQDMIKADNIDFILWTGDSPAHDIWEENQDMQLNRMTWISNLLDAYFPDTPIWPSFGNHDNYPVDQFAQPPLNSWLMQSIYKDWRRWLPEDAQETFLSGGYYTALIQPGLRVVSLNTMYCDSSNFWLWLNTSDVGQTAWFERVLQSAEQNKEKVYVIGHIPPASQTCRSTIPEDYYNLVARYNQTLIGQFYGHTHYDQIELFRDTETNLIPLGVAYIAPSVDTSSTGYGFTNPSYRVFTADPSSFEIENYSQYYFDLIQANQDGEIKFQLEYDARSSYDLPDLSPSSWQGLVQRMSTNHSLLLDFLSHTSALGPLNDPQCTDTNCIKNLLCSMQSGTGTLYNTCMSE